MARKFVEDHYTHRRRVTVKTAIRDDDPRPLSVAALEADAFAAAAQSL